MENLIQEATKKNTNNNQELFNVLRGCPKCGHDPCTCRHKNAIEASGCRQCGNVPIVAGGLCKDCL